MSNVQDAAAPAAPESAPAMKDQTETAPVSVPTDAAPLALGPSQERSFDDDFPDKPDKSFDEDFPDKQPAQDGLLSKVAHFGPGGMATIPAGDRPVPLTLDADQWKAYLNNSTLGRTLSAFGEAFTGPSITEDLLKWGFDPEQAQAQTDSYAQTILRPMAHSSKLLMAGFAAVPVALFEGVTKTIAGTLAAAEEAGVPREILQAAETELNVGHVIPGGGVHLPGPRVATATEEAAAQAERVRRMPVEPRPTDTVNPRLASQAETWAAGRLAGLEEKAAGTPDIKTASPEGQAGVIPGRPGQPLTPDELAERDFLRSDPHGDHVLAVYPGLANALDRPPRVPPYIARARANAVIGEGEEGYFGTAAPTEADLAARRAAAAELPDDSTPAAAAPGAEPAPPPSLDQVARNLRPEAFREWDTLQAQKADLGRWMRELPETTRANIEAKPPEALRDLDAEIVRTERQARKPLRGQADAQERLDALRDQREALVDDLVANHPDMKTVRDAYNKVDYRLRDLAPDVSAATREAADLLPEPVPETVEPAPAVAEVAPEAVEGPARPAESAPEPAKPPESGGKRGPVSTQEMVEGIHLDVAKQLVAAGRSPEEAAAAAEWITAQVVRRAERFRGNLGTARELFDREGADVVRAAENTAPPKRQKVLAQSKGGDITFYPNSLRPLIRLIEGKADASTVVHEYGHKFLEEFMRDAEHAQAPQELKDDAATLLKFLKMEKPADIRETGKRGKYTPKAREANELFARAWERFLWEGRAPSSALKRVFEQFREWMLAIYDTAAKLRAPITDDVRAVFGRMLEVDPHNVVIAPELPLETGLADKHMGLVESTPGKHAGKAAEQVHRETAAEARAKAQEITHELQLRRGESEGTAGSGEPQRPDAGSGGAAPGNLAGENGGIPEPRAVLPGRSGPAAEIPGPPGEAGGLAPSRPKALYDKVPKRPPSLADWIKARGGVQDLQGEIKALGKTKPGLIKAEGQKIDDVVLDAWENGFFPESPERPTVPEFLNKLETDLKGNHQWSEHDADAVAEYQNALGHNAEVDRLANELGIEQKGLSHDDFWNQVAERKSTEDQAKIIEDQAEAQKTAMAEADRLREEALADKNSSWQPDALESEPARTLEDLENERRQEIAARGQVASPAGDGGPRGPAERPAGVPEGGGPRGRGAEPAGSAGQAEAAPEAGQPGAPGPGRDTGTGPGPKPATAEPAEPVPGPNTAFENREPHLVDKAGNIRLDNLNATEDVKAVLRDFAERNGDFTDARRGVVTDAERIAYAEAMGVDAHEINIDKLRAMSLEDGIPLAARIEAGRMMLEQSAKAVFDAMAGTDEMAYLDVSQRHLRIQETLSGITAEWGRAGRAFRNRAEEAQKAQELSEFLRENTGRTLFQVQLEMRLGKKLKNPGQVSKSVREWAKPDNWDKTVEVWINGLLSGPQTHMANVAGNSIAAVYQVAETGLSAGIGFARHLATGTQDRVFFGEAIEQLFAIREGTMEGLTAAAAILKDEKLVDSLGLLDQARPGAISGLKGEIIRAPGRALAAEDAIFKAVAYRQKINQLAYREATKAGLEGDAKAQKIASLKNTPTAAMMKEAVDFSRYQTFNKELGPIGKNIQKAIAGHPSFKFIVPFMRTPTNVFKYTVERSPLALVGLMQDKIGAEVGANLRGENGAVARDTQVARIALGTGMIVAGYTMAAAGEITGGGPTNPAERAQWIREGHQPYSYKAFGEWHSYARFEPLATLLGGAADAWEIRKNATEKETSDWGKMLVSSLMTNLMNKASLRGPADFFQFMSDPDKSFGKYASGFVSSFIPAIFAQGARTMDHFQRETMGFRGSILSRIPIVRERYLHPRVDVWGRDMVDQGADGPDFMSPSFHSAIVNDPVEREMNKIGFFPSKMSSKIRGVRLTNDQYYEIQKLAGRIARQKIQEATQEPAWKELPASERLRFARNVFNNPKSGAREIARSTIIFKSRGTDNDIDKKAKANQAAIARDLESRAHSAED